MTQAFSYIRFSSPQQEMGDSVRRQEKKAVEYAAQHNLTLDTRSYRDLGLSAWDKTNVTKGNFGKFLLAVEQGKIPKGSYLLVESLDRISRADVDDALELLLSIVRKGIIVVTLDDRQEYSKQRIKQDHGISLIISIARMSRANEESARKSDRVHEAWEGRRAAGVILTGVGPAWLKLSEDRKRWIILENKAEVVREIFRLALAGNGSPSIARMLNSRGVPTMLRAAHWTFATVAALLKNQSVFGLYTPKKALSAAPIPDYYPAIVTETEFRLVQESMSKRKWIGGRSSHYVNNLFAGISYCHVCGAKMRAVGNSGRHLYLRCLNAYSNNGCREGRFPYLAAETAILRFLADDLSRIMATDNEQVDPVVALEAERTDLIKKLERLVTALEETDDSTFVAARINALERQLRSVEQSIRTAQPANYRLDPEEMNSLFDKLKGVDGPIERELRLRVQETLRRVIERVEFWCDAEHDRPSVSLQFYEEYGGYFEALDVSRYREQRGGARIKKRVGS
ncbi:recombinase family protein [Dechloromonas sp. ZY10]|uniref:recombinase family protein n=1 Tax=Dechloromonas aquae TaxID=2664436 RepID=UPI003527F7F2